MTEQELNRICERSPECGCNCMECEAFAAYYRSNAGRLNF